MVGDGEIGITTLFGSVVPASNAGPRARFVSAILPAPCRLCGGPTWLTDDLGAIHPCCELMWTDAGGCLSCRTSEHLNRQHRQRKLTKVKGVDMLAITEADSFSEMETE